MAAVHELSCKTEAQPEAIVAALNAILAPGQVTELRALNASTTSDRRSHVESGYFDDPRKLAEAVARITSATGIYFTPNPVNPALLSRCANRTQAAGRGDSTADTDIIARRWLLIDVDPARPAKVSASMVEHEHGLAVARSIRDALTDRGWPQPILADSGNGGHLYYRVDLPSDDAQLIERVLAALALRFDDDAAIVDQSVYNPARIWKLPGTMACKGDNTPERPHRLARILDLPEALEPVSREQLEELVVPLPPPPPKPKRRTRTIGKPYDLARWIKNQGLDLRGPFAWGSGRKWVFDVCPWNPDHTNRSAFLLQFEHGAIAAGCHHNSCQGRGWTELRALYEDVPARMQDAAPLPRDSRQLVEQFQTELNRDPASAIRTAMASPATVAALSEVQRTDRAAYEALALALADRGALVKDVEALHRAVRAERRQQKLRLVTSREVEEPPKIHEFLPDAPVPPSAVVPAGWQLTEDGVQQRKPRSDGEGGQVDRLIRVCSTPVVIESAEENLWDQTEVRTLRWRDQGRWRKASVQRRDMANARGLIELAAVGFPVNSENARKLVSFLAAFEAENLSLLPKRIVSDRLGWLGEDGDLGFLCGERHLAPPTRATMPVYFTGKDTGDHQLADGFGTSGTLEGWSAAIASIRDYPRVLLAVYASLAAPILNVLGAHNFVVDWSNETSTGKTTVLRVAASVWGNPEEHSTRTVIQSWDSTRVWMERASTILNSLPLIVDETKKAKNPEEVARTIYDVANGRGRGRGSIGGLAAVGVWRTVLLSTGETPITALTQDGGTRARVLALWGPPFGQANATTAAIVTELNTALITHYGHAGPAFVEYLLAHREDWATWRGAYQAKRAEYITKAGDNPILARMADYLACLWMTARVFDLALDSPWAGFDPVDCIWSTIASEANEADRAEAARAHVLSWAMGNETAFWGRHQQDRDRNPKVPNNGWAGAWDEREAWTSIAFLTHRISELLTEAGFDEAATLRTWKDRGWILVDTDRPRNAKQVRINGNKSWAVVLRRPADLEASSDGSGGGDSGDVVGTAVGTRSWQ